MCEERTCRPCKNEDRLLDRAMGSYRTYTKSTLPSAESNPRPTTTIHLNLMSTGKGRISKNMLMP
ncbi:hypothetical protein SEA_BURLEY_52 [Gordonia phage Burley]|nr:hypothetical protein SEA_NADMEG_53 [Gordonia phage Nadmeg]USH44713.1 hypothetical protein SEA_BURLEY_52 [Gordonia phage Burley]WIC89944.1 hypothetical protein SEA_HYDRUS_54 [Gordonia phage Hydrus]